MSWSLVTLGQIHDLIRLPDVPARGRQKILDDLLSRFAEQLEEAAIITVRNGRIRISKRPE